MPHAIVGSISLIAQAIVNLIVEQRQIKAQESINNQSIEVASVSGRKKRFKVRTWEELRIGDIVKLYQNQEAPADIIILDIQGSK